jgi:ComF family protein
MLSPFLDLLFPDRCPACDAMTPQAGLCGRCALSLYPLGEACPVCALPERSSVTCARCRLWPPPWRAVRAPWRYGGELAAAIRRFKWGARGRAGRPELGRPLGRLLVPALAGVAVDLVVPVPLHPARLRERGFSQALVLAACARGPAAVRAPLAPEALERRRPTAVQAGLGRAAREQNVAGAFVVPEPARVRGRRVLLVDDVVTTGATAAACVRALRRAGAAEVTVAALARAETC